MTILIFIIILSLLILSHEFGHFIVAKKTGMAVQEFGIGFPPRLFGVKKNETLYSINALPFGGFVKIKGEEGENESDPDSFSSKPTYTRLLVLSSGVVFNFILGYLLFVWLAFYDAPWYEALARGYRRPQSPYRFIPF
ncbi:MAG: site-2 protease family protein, partial [Patescibacteria group bacterium]